MTFSKELIQFAGTNLDFYTCFADYYMNEKSRTPENSEKIHNAFFAEIEKRSGIARNPAEASIWASNPQVQWASFAVIDALVSSVLPQVLNPTIGMFTDLRPVGYGDVVKFKVLPRQLFTVSQGAHGQRGTVRQKQYKGDMLLGPTEKIITVYVDFYSVLCGKEDIAEFVKLVVLAIQRKMEIDAMDALTTGLSAVAYPSVFKKTGAFDASTLIELVETVKAYNYGVQPVVLGTMAALAKVIPNSSLGFRGNWDADNGSIKIMKDFYGAELMVLPQYANGANPSDGLALPSDTLYVVSPGMDKLVKGK